jgi:hypothetical protein
MTKQHAAMQAQLFRTRSPSSLASISKHLEALQLGPVHVNTAAPGSSVFVDILLPNVVCEGKPVAIAISGVHDTATNTGRPLGHWLLRCNLIQTCGLHLLSISDDAWESCPNPHATQLMLRSLLQGCKRAHSTEHVFTA